MVPWEQASKQPKAGMSSPPAKIWILSRPPLISSTILPNRCAPPCSTSRAGVQVVDRRHWNFGWAMTFGAFTTVAAVAAASVAPFRMNRLRPSIDTSIVCGSSLTAAGLLVIGGQRIPQAPVLLGQTRDAQTWRGAARSARRSRRRDEPMDRESAKRDEPRGYGKH